MTMADDLQISMLATPAAGLARTLVEQRLRKWDHSLICGDAALVTSELVANAAKETPCRQIVFRLCLRVRLHPGPMGGKWVYARLVV